MRVGSATMVMLAVLVTEAGAPSVTASETLVVAAAVGVPLICPVVAFRVRPAGRLPALTRQVTRSCPARHDGW